MNKHLSSATPEGQGAVTRAIARVVGLAITSLRCPLRTLFLRVVDYLGSRTAFSRTSGGNLTSDARLQTRIRVKIRDYMPSCLSEKPFDQRARDEVSSCWKRFLCVPLRPLRLISCSEKGTNRRGRRGTQRKNWQERRLLVLLPPRHELEILGFHSAQYGC